MEFGSWEVFTNDEHTRSFLSLEIVAMGNPEVRVLDCKQLSAALSSITGFSFGIGFPLSM
jgi:hypothetical protein